MTVRAVWAEIFRSSGGQTNSQTRRS